jgi:type I restriction enzyme S subunit
MKSFVNKQSEQVTWNDSLPIGWEFIRLKWTTNQIANGIWGDEPNGSSDDIICVRVADFDRTAFKVNLNKPTLRNIPYSQRYGRLLKSGDLLIEKSGGGELQPVGTVAIYDHNNPAVCSNFVARVEVREGYVPRFLTYLHAHLYSIKVNTRSIKQTTGIQNLDSQSYFDEFAGVPPLETQKLIATFLDRKTAAIDTLIAKKQRLIQLLEEKCKVLINQAVTKGSNPNVPMKDSGIPWIGKIPEHWEVKRLKYLTTKIIDGTHFTPTYIDSGIPFLRVTDIHHNHIDWSTVKFISEIEHFELSKRCKVEKNDVLLSKNGTIGITFVVNFDRPVSIFVSLCLLKLRKNILLPKFFASLFQTYAIEEQIAEGSKKNTVTNLHLNKICEFWIPVPPIDEQQIILDEINKAGQQIKKLIGSIELQIEKLQEYRRSLITAAVTGKLNIKEVETNV